MTDLRTRFRTFDRVPTPDYWSDALNRAGGDMDAGAPDRRLLAVIVALALVAAVGGAVIVGGGLLPMPGPSATPGPTEPSECPVPSGTPSPSARPSVAAGPLDISWEAVTGIESTASIYGMAFADDQWFALGMRDLGGSGEEDGTQDAAIWRSDDGRTWVAAEIRAVDAEGDYSVVHDLVDVDGVLVAIGSWGAMQSDQLAWVTWLSTDGGATWTESRDTPGPFGAMQAITPGGPGLVAAGWTYAGTIPYDSYFVTSRDGMAWDEVGAPLVAAAVHGLGALGERLVAVGVDWTDPPLAYEAQPTAWYSDDDGETWTAVELPGAAPDNLDHPQDVVPFNDGLVAVGGSMDVGSWITPDGETWERFDVALNAAFGAGAALDGALVAVGNTPLAGGQEIGPGVTWTSRDAQSWSAGPVLSEGGVGLRAVAESDGVVVAGGTCDRVDPCQAVMWRGEVVR